jgi:hypothetical protein
MRGSYNLFLIFVLSIIFGQITSFGQSPSALKIDTVRYLEGFNYTNFQVRTNTGLQTTPEGNIWLSFPTIGLAYYSQPNGTSTPYGSWSVFNKANTNNSLSNDTIHCIYYDSTNSILWIAQNSGLTKKTNNGFTTFPFASPYIYNTNRINDISVSGSYVYLATKNGLLVFNSNNNTWQTYNTTNSSLPNDTVNSLFTNSIQDIWICTNNGAIKKNNQGQFSNHISIPNFAVKYIGITNYDTLIAGNTGLFRRLNGTLLYLDSLLNPIAGLQFSNGCDSSSFGAIYNPNLNLYSVFVISPFIINKQEIG